MIGRLFVVFTMAIVFLSACSGDNYDAYIGHWEKDGDLRVVEITKEGDHLIFRENILNDNEGIFSEADRKPHVLTKNEGQLLFMGIIALGLSEDKKQLYLDGKTYNRIDDERLSEITNILAEKKAAAEKLAQEKAREDAIRNENIRLCNELQDEYWVKTDELRKVYPSRQNGFKGGFNDLKKLRDAHKQKQEALREEYNERKTKIPNCVHLF